MSKVAVIYEPVARMNRDDYRIWADKQQIAHHRRDDDGKIETRTIAGGGEVTLDPPGITITVEEIYAA